MGGPRDKMSMIIIELVDSISRNGPDMSIYIIRYKQPKSSD